MKCSFFFSNRIIFLLLCHISDVLSPFTEGDFSTTDLTSEALSSGQDLSELTAKLDKGVSLLEEELKVEVISHHEDLLQQSGNITELDKLLENIRTNVKLLQTSIRK